MDLKGKKGSLERNYNYKNISNYNFFFSIIHIFSMDLKGKKLQSSTKLLRQTRIFSTTCKTKRLSHYMAKMQFITLNFRFVVYKSEK